jgi:hypothetical protein
MRISIPGVAVQSDALLAGQPLDALRLVRWARDLVEVAASTVGFEADVRVGTPPADWSVEVRISGRPLVLVDVATEALDPDSLDRLELRAGHVWRDLTRSATLFEPRPWIGAIRVTEEQALEAVGVERTRRLVASRVLDAACVIALDRPARTVRSPNAATSIESFVAAGVGRFLVLAAGTAPPRQGDRPPA